MKEKIKNFLLKIKNFFNEKHTFTFIQLVVIAILINFITMFLSFMEIKALDLCFNETHIEQAEETPQTESMRIEKDLKFANPSSSDYINPNNTYNVIYCNNTLDNETTYNDLLTFYNLYGSNFIPYDGNYIYPFYGYNEYGDSNPYCICFLYQPLQYGVGIAIMTFNLNTLEPYQFWYSSFIEDNNSLLVSIPLPSFMLPSMIMASITPFTSFNLGGIDVPIGVLNQVLFSNFSSIQFEITPQQPILENAPSTLVNTIPSNALTSLPNNLGTKVYDSGSAWVQDPNTFSEYNAFGYQIYYKSSILTSETDMLRFTIDGITYDVEPTIYRYYLSEVYFVIYTLWDDTPIYYVSNNILDTPFPFTLDYATRFNISDLINWLSVRVDIVETYSDYLHIRFNYDYFMRLTHSDEFVWLIDEESQSFDALIFSTADKPSIIKNDGFMLSIIPELDTRFSKMGQNQTNNMYSTIVHGGTINQVWSNAYHKGIDVGETNGYTNGYNDGIETGKTLQNPLNPIMDFISDGALVISNVFSFEILPNISLGTMLLFPLAIALIWFVIKLFMGG